MLTDKECKNAKPKNKVYTLSDEKGLILEVRADGSKYWRLAYRVVGIQKRLSLGSYKEVSLKEASNSFV